METVAQSANVPLDQLRSISRVAITSGYFLEPQPDHLAHSAVSSLVANDPDNEGWAYFLANVMYPASDKIIEATEKWGDSTSNAETAYCLSFATEKPMFHHLFEDKTRAAKFAGFTKAMAKTGNRNTKFLIDGFEWGKVEHVVDVSAFYFSQPLDVDMTDSPCA